MLFRDWEWWSPVSAIPPILAIALCFAWSLYILAYPPLHKKLSIALLGLPTAYAFYHHEAIAPDFMLSDTIGRFLYIWYVHMSYEVVILEFAPAAQKDKDKDKVGQAYRVLWDRNHAPFLEAKARELVREEKRRDSLQDDDDGGQEAAQTVPTLAVTTSTATTATTTTKRDVGTNHGYSYARFTRHHALQFIVLFSIITLYDKFRNYTYIHSFAFAMDPSPGSFFRRLPASLGRDELLYRAQCCWDWTVISLFEYELYYSLCALIFVSLLRFDAPSDWPLSLCGHLSEAWSMRQYWGKHWHNYIYHSFNAHTKILTRQWLGFRRGRTTTRLLENTIVFAVSGIMHTVVRWVQGSSGSHWPITYWYVGQMVPIILESVVQHYWRMARKRVNTQKYGKSVHAFELAVGYAWVAGWFMWSVPKYNAAAAQWRIAQSMGADDMGHGVEAVKMFNESGQD